MAIAPTDDTGQPPPHWYQSLRSTADVQSGCELDIFHLVTELIGRDEESPTCLIQMEEGGKCYRAKEHAQLIRGGRRYSWDIPPDENSQTVTVNDGFEQQSIGGRRFSWDKPPNLTAFDTGLVNLQCIGGKNYRWDSYRAPSHEEFDNLWI